MRDAPRPPIPPPSVPPGYVANLPGRGEVFYRHHRRPDQASPTLLLLHGWTATADLQWFTAYRELAERYSFVAVDHRGHGRGLRSEQRYTLEDAADDAAALVRHLGLGPVVAVGYSMGGPVSMLLAHRHPDLVGGLVVEATALEWRARRRDRTRWWFLFGLEAVLRSRLTQRLTRRMVRRLARGNDAIEPWLPWLVAEGERGDPAAIVDAGRALSRYDSRPWAGSLGVPAGLLLTTQDRVVRPERQRALADALHAQVRELEGDHFAFWAKAAEFSTATRTLVDGVVQAASTQAGVAGGGDPSRRAAS